MMRALTTRRARIVAGAGASVVALTATAAIAYVSTGSASGGGSVTATDTVSMRLTVSTPNQAAGFGPGSSATASVEVANDNNHVLRIVSVVSTGTATVTKVRQGDCAPGDVWVTSADGLAIDIPARDTAQVPVTVTMSPGAGSGCQGATFNLPVVVSGRVQ